MWQKFYSADQKDKADRHRNLDDSSYDMLSG